MVNRGEDRTGEKERDLGIPFGILGKARDEEVKHKGYHAGKNAL